MLPDFEIHLAVTNRSSAYAGLKIDGYNEDNLNPASYDLTLSSKIRVVNHFDAPKLMDVQDIEAGYTYLQEIRQAGHILLAGSFMLGASNEVITLPPNLGARIEGKSSLGRLGLMVHITAGFIDPGFHGTVTFEIVNLLGKPIRLRKNMKIAQIAFIPMTDKPQNTYGVRGHYQHQGLDGEPIESRYHMDI